MNKFSSLETFQFSQSNPLESNHGKVNWPKSLTEIFLNGSGVLTVEPYFFSLASNLSTLSITSPVDLKVSTNGFHTTSFRTDKVISINTNSTIYESNAFGNVDGGELWQKMDINSNGFPEDVFRIMIKAYFDKGNTGMSLVSKTKNSRFSMYYVSDGLHDN